MKRALSLLVAASLFACTKPEASVHRVTVEREGPQSFRVFPTAGQLPFCLLFSTSAKGVTRQLTMSPTNTSLPCPAGKPVGDALYRAPLEDGKARLYVVFSDREIEAIPIAQQIREISDHGGVVTAMGLRAPGQLAIDSFDLAPGG